MGSEPTAEERAIAAVASGTCGFVDLHSRDCDGQHEPIIWRITQAIRAAEAAAYRRGIEAAAKCAREFHDHRLQMYAKRRGAAPFRRADLDRYVCNEYDEGCTCLEIFNLVCALPIEPMEESATPPSNPEDDPAS